MGPVMVSRSSAGGFAAGSDFCTSVNRLCYPREPETSGNVSMKRLINRTLLFDYTPRVFGPTPRLSRVLLLGGRGDDAPGKEESGKLMFRLPERFGRYKDKG